MVATVQRRRAIGRSPACSMMRPTWIDPEKLALLLKYANRVTDQLPQIVKDFVATQGKLFPLFRAVIFLNHECTQGDRYCWFARKWKIHIVCGIEVRRLFAE